MWHIRRTVTDDIAKTIACSFVTSRLDYVNFALYGISAKNIHRLQWMQNTLARVVLGSSAAKFSHSIDMLCYLHWLPVEYWIKFKLAKLAFNTRNQWRSNRVCRVCNAHGPDAAGGPEFTRRCFFSSNVDCIRINLENIHWIMKTVSAVYVYS